MSALNCRLFGRQILILLLKPSVLCMHICNVGDIDSGLKLIHFKIRQQQYVQEMRRLEYQEISS